MNTGILDLKEYFNGRKLSQRDSAQYEVEQQWVETLWFKMLSCGNQIGDLCLLHGRLVLSAVMMEEASGWATWGAI